MVNSKKHFRILPIFIFLAVLTLSVKVNNVFDLLKHPENLKFSISQQSAFAEEKAAPETEKLSQVLDQNAQNSSAMGLNTENPNNSFSQSEILILQELAERREALDLRAKEIDRKAIQLKVAEEEIDKKIKQLQDYEQRLKKLMTEYNQEEKAKITSLANHETQRCRPHFQHFGNEYSGSPAQRNEALRVLGNSLADELRKSQSGYDRTDWTQLLTEIKCPNA